jgi:hypothetical protein
MSGREDHERAPMPNEVTLMSVKDTGNEDIDRRVPGGKGYWRLEEGKTAGLDKERCLSESTKFR